MDLLIRRYNLPDISIIEKNGCGFIVWQPERDYIILGQSNDVEKSLDEEEVITDCVPVYKRPSGGDAVILTPKTLVIAKVVKQDLLKNPQAYFETFNSKVISALNSLGVKNIETKGISDIAIGDKKIFGSSIYRSGNILFYHAVLNVNETTEKMERYLKYPQREPDYRHKRTHRDFVTSLFAQGYHIDMKLLKEEITKAFCES
ncbi:MAG: hypothetical protein Q8862_00875 [Bacteroidota bacterium]|nr:hypothetical protein [Bacteroidota bacterium]MDP4206995.1 hypothetical protein [Bacteroidota bacterium]